MLKVKFKVTHEEIQNISKLAEPKMTLIIKKLIQKKMIRILLALTISTITYLQCYSQQTATLLYNWQDTSLVGSWMYDNTYNEWGRIY